MRYGLWTLELRSATPGNRHRPPWTPRLRTLCAMTYRRESYGADHLNIVIGHLKLLDGGFYALWIIDAKSNGAHHLDIVIGHLEHLNAALFVSWRIDAKSYGPHHLDLRIGHLEYLGAALQMLWRIHSKSYGAHNLDIVNLSVTQKCVFRLMPRNFRFNSTLCTKDAKCIILGECEFWGRA